MINVDFSCTGCGVCATVCQANAIKMVYKNGFQYPEVDVNLCIKCNKCNIYCSKEEKYKESAYRIYYGNSNDIKIVKQSSSGGAFFEICKYCIEKRSSTACVPVYETNRVVRRFILDTNELERYALGSKYIQCESFDKYNHVRDLLKKGEIVYFSGTPCQVAALKKYLDIEYPNLITQDIICHGVGSKVIFEKYLRSISHGRKVKKVSFRDKAKGWHSISIRIEFNNKKTYLRKHTKDRFMKLYSGNFILRPSCYNCNFKGRNRCSDLTLADFWGADKVIGTKNDEGISLIIANSVKGNELIGKADLSLKELYTDEALNYNPVYSVSVKKRKGYDKEVESLINSKSFCIPYIKLRFHLFVERVINRLGR